LLRSIDYAEQREQGIRLRLRLPPSLSELPWEYLYDPTRSDFSSIRRSRRSCAISTCRKASSH
jgi:hypothetical protein